MGTVGRGQGQPLTERGDGTASHHCGTRPDASLGATPVSPLSATPGPTPQNPPGQGAKPPETEWREMSSSATTTNEVPQAPPAKGSGGPARSPCTRVASQSPTGSGSPVLGTPVAARGWQPCVAQPGMLAPAPHPCWLVPMSPAAPLPLAGGETEAQRGDSLPHKPCPRWLGLGRTLDWGSPIRAPLPLSWPSQRDAGLGLVPGTSAGPPAWGTQQLPAQTLPAPTCLRPSKLIVCRLPPSPRLQGGHLHQHPPSSTEMGGGPWGDCERRGPAGPGRGVGAAGCLLGDVGEVVPPSVVVVVDLVSGETAKRGMPGGGGGASICVGR